MVNIFFYFSQMYRLFFFLSSFISLFGLTNVLSQNTLTNNPNSISFWDTESSRPVTIINDSLWAIGFDPTNITKIPISKELAFKNGKEAALESNTRVLNFLKVFHTNSETFLVEEGCGSVLHFKNDSLIRIDNSFSHRNQYQASTFSHNNLLYYFGGQGLFTIKNVLTRYDYESREWFKIQTYGLRPDPLAGAFPLVLDDTLIVFGGTNEEHPNTNVYQLNLLTNTWSILGSLKIEIPIGKENFFGNLERIESSYYFIFESFLWEINPVDNFVKKYINKDKHLFSEGSKILAYDEVLQKFHYTYVDNKKKLQYRTLDLSRLASILVFEDSFYQNQSPSFYYYMVGLLFLVLLCFIGGLAYKHNYYHLIGFNGIRYNLKKNLLSYKGLEIIEFSSQEKELVLFLLSQNSFVPITSLNDFVETNNTVYSIDVINKRRINTLKNITYITLKYSKIKTSTVFFYKKDPLDKRIQLIKINNNLLKNISL
jgi:hypothetical protein